MKSKLSLWSISPEAFFLVTKDVSATLMAVSYKDPPVVFIPEQCRGTEEKQYRTSQHGATGSSCRTRGTSDVS